MCYPLAKFGGDTSNGFRFKVLAYTDSDTHTHSYIAAKRRDGGHYIGVSNEHVFFNILNSVIDFRIIVNDNVFVFNITKDLKQGRSLHAY